MFSSTASDHALDRSALQGSAGWTRLILPCGLGWGFGIAAQIAILLPSLSAEWSAGDAGTATAVQAIGVVLAASLSGLLIRRIGTAHLVRSALILAAVALTLLPASESSGAVLALRLLLGLGVGAGVAATEYLVLAQAPHQHRPIYLSAYAIAGALGIASGPALLYLSGATGGVLRIIAACLLLGAAATLCVRSKPGAAPVSGTDIEDEPGRMPPYIWGAALLYGALHTGFLSFAGRYAAAMDRSSEDAVLITFTALMGIVLLQLPCGYLCSRLDPRWTLLTCCTLGTALLATLPLASNHGVFLYLWMFALGGVIDCIYTSGLCSAVLTVSRNRLASVTSLYFAVCSMGEVIGPLGSGHVLDACGPSGLIIVFTGLTLTIALQQLFAFWNIRLRIAPSLNFDKDSAASSCARSQAHQA